MDVGQTGSNRVSLARRLHSVGPALGLALLCVAGVALNRDFASAANVLNVLSRTAFIGIIGVGMCFVITTGGIDLSVGSMAALIAGCVILFINAAAPFLHSAVTAVVLGATLAVVIGAICGLAHGLLVTKGRIEPFIVTLGTLGIFRAVLTYLSNGGALSLDDSLLNVYAPVYYGSVAGVPVPVCVFVLVAIVGGVILNRTPHGRYVQAIGSNEQGGALRCGRRRPGQDHHLHAARRLRRHCDAAVCAAPWLRVANDRFTVGT